MLVKPIKTSIIKEGNSIKNILKQYLLDEPLESSIIAITSKIISICEGRLIPKEKVSNKQALIEIEADYTIDSKNITNEYTITIKNGILIPCAGIDESNAENSYILYPKDVHASCIDIWSWIKKEFNLKNVGVLITDSHTTPMRAGVTGIALSWCGFEAQYSYIGTEDLFSRPLKCTKVNVIDAIAAAAVFEMGEAAEQTPIAIVKSDNKKIVYRDTPTTTEDIKASNISIDEDVYGDILKAVSWKKKIFPSP